LTVPGRAEFAQNAGTADIIPSPATAIVVKLGIIALTPVYVNAKCPRKVPLLPEVRLHLLKVKIEARCIVLGARSSSINIGQGLVRAPQLKSMS
jgi:hypothetical protein